MKKALLIIVLLSVATLSVKALPADSTRRNAFAQKLLDNFSIAGCELSINYCIPLHEHLPQFPMAYRDYTSPVKPSVGFPLANNSSFRFFGIYYHDRYGLELTWNSFGGDVDMTRFSDYVRTRYAAYNTTAYIYNNRLFSGPVVSLAYQFHINKCVLTPKLSLGFEKLQVFDYMQTYRENGSNQFVEHSITQTITTGFQHSYHAELDLGRRFSLKKSRYFRLEAGFRAEYIYAPYSMDVSMTEKPFAQAATIANFSYSSALQVFSAGVYITFVILK